MCHARSIQDARPVRLRHTYQNVVRTYLDAQDMPGGYQYPSTPGWSLFLLGRAPDARPSLPKEAREGFLFRPDKPLDGHAQKHKLEDTLQHTPHSHIHHRQHRARTPHQVHSQTWSRVCLTHLAPATEIGMPLLGLHHAQILMLQSFLHNCPRTLHVEERERISWWSFVAAPLRQRGPSRAPRSSMMEQLAAPYLFQHLAQSRKHLSVRRSTTVRTQSVQARSQVCQKALLVEGPHHPQQTEPLYRPLSEAPIHQQKKDPRYPTLHGAQHPRR